MSFGNRLAKIAEAEIRRTKYDGAVKHGTEAARGLCRAK